MPKNTKPVDQGRVTPLTQSELPVDTAGDAARRDETLRRMLMTPARHSNVPTPAIKPTTKPARQP